MKQPAKKFQLKLQLEEVSKLLTSYANSILNSD